MIKKEQLERNILKESNDYIAYYASRLEDDDYAEEILCKSEIEKYKNIYYNYEEASSIIAVHYINNILSIYHKGGDIVHNRYAAKLSIMDFDDKIIKCILDSSI